MAPPKPSLGKQVDLKPTTKILDADAILKSQESTDEKEGLPENTETLQPEANESVKLEELQRCWKAFAEKRRDAGKDAEYVLLNQSIELREEHIIEIRLTNTVQQPILDGLRTELTQYLRHHLKNNLLTLDAKLVQMESKDMVYTAREKFNYLAEKHPELKILKERLGLDTDF